MHQASPLLDRAPIWRTGAEDAPVNVVDRAFGSGDAIEDYPSQAGVLAMRAAFRNAGGISSACEVGRLLELNDRADFGRLARLMIHGDIFGFEWHQTVWLPRFQFDDRNQSIKPGPRKVSNVLAAELDGWRLSAWFARKNRWLADRRPVDLLGSDLPAIVRAARADAFLWAAYATSPLCGRDKGT